RSAWLHLRQAREDDPDNPNYLRERLRQLRSGLPFFSSGADRTGERSNIARKLLEVHGNDAVALEEIATTAAWDYFWLERRFGARAGDRMRARIDGYLGEAIDHFELAVDANPGRAETYREFLRLLIRSGQIEKALTASARMTEHLPDSSAAWMLRGLIMHLDRQPEIAWAQFRRGLSLMDPNERGGFDAWQLLVRPDLRDSLVAAGEAAEQAFWRLRDTRRMTDVNERLVSHYGRLVYSDLFYPRWRERADDGWLITPGEVIVRYGYPRSERQLPRSDPSAPGGPSPTASILLYFADRSFLFEDLTGDGELLIPTTHGENDAVTAARSEFFGTPELADVPGKEIFEVPYIVTRFPSPGDATDVVVSYGVPVFAEDLRNHLPIATRSGAFVVDEEGYDVDRSVRISRSMPRGELVRADTLLLWSNAATLAAPPGSYRLQLEVESSDMIASHWESIELARSDDDRLWISDIMPATLVEPVSSSTGGPGIVRGGYRIRPAPMTLFSRDAPLYLYFELGGLDTSAGDARYETEVFIADVREGGILSAIGRLLSGEGVRVAASFVSSIGVSSDRQYFVLDVRDEDPGDHVIGVRITDLTTDASVEAVLRVEIR
ncbi:MAG: tetratricopeptide repeat protein, partial [Rhodothermales bacterium]|nr:tetratricopeptide repeat protein [Rhodothermales bacterium]